MEPRYSPTSTQTDKRCSQDTRADEEEEWISLEWSTKGCCVPDLSENLSQPHQQRTGIKQHQEGAGERNHCQTGSFSMHLIPKKLPSNRVESSRAVSFLF